MVSARPAVSTTGAATGLLVALIVLDFLLSQALAYVLYLLESPSMLGMTLIPRYTSCLD